MTSSGGRSHPYPVTDSSQALLRWECRCRQPPVLLATYDNRGHVHIKVRNRHWHTDGVVHAVCPRCGNEQTLDLRVEKSRNREVES